MRADTGYDPLEAVEDGEEAVVLVDGEAAVDGDEDAGGEVAAVATAGPPPSPGDEDALGLLRP